MQKSAKARKNRIISTMNGQFQSALPIFKTNRKYKREFRGGNAMDISIIVENQNLIIEYVL